jgi:hypothetical protein
LLIAYNKNYQKSTSEDQNTWLAVGVDSSASGSVWNSSSTTFLYHKSIVGMMDLGNPRIFVTYGKDRAGPSSYIVSN